MTRQPFIAAILSLVLTACACAQPGREIDDGMAALVGRVNELEKLVKEYEARPRPATWEDFGCVAGDRSIDNAPMLSKMLRLGGGMACKAETYHCQTEIDWPHKVGGSLRGCGGSAASKWQGGVTRIQSSAADIIRYSGSGGLVADVVIEGEGSNRGFAALNDDLPPTGHLVTRDVSLNRLNVGFETLLEPKTLHATEFTHYNLRFHGVKQCYIVSGRQSCDHSFYKVGFRAGWERAFVFNQNADGKPGCGGPLNVWGCYIGKNYRSTLLTLGRTDSGTGAYSIQGIHTDGTSEELRLLEYSRLAHRVRFEGNISSSRYDANGDDVKGPSLADEYLVPRESAVLADIQVDLRGVVKEVRAPQ